MTDAPDCAYWSPEDPRWEAKRDAMRRSFDITPEQYHAGLDKLWDALGLHGVQQQDVFTLANVSRKIKGMEEQGGVTPMYIAPGNDISLAVAEALNRAYKNSKKR